MASSEVGSIGKLAQGTNLALRGIEASIWDLSAVITGYLDELDFFTTPFKVLGTSVACFRLLKIITDQIPSKYHSGD